MHPNQFEEWRIHVPCTGRGLAERISNVADGSLSMTGGSREANGGRP
jgi:hypothetical protein